MKEQSQSFMHFLVKHRFELVFSSIQAALVVLFCLFTSFGPAGSLALASTPTDKEGSALYPYYQDTKVMLLLGVGFIMTSLRSHAWTSIGLNLLICALAMQVYVLSIGFWTCVVSREWRLIEVSVKTLVAANFCTSSVLIGFGAVLGKMSPLQHMTMALCQTFLYALQAYVFYVFFEGVDAGGSITTHTYGTYFGLTTTWIIEHSGKKCKTEVSSHSNLFCWIGTLLLWVYWPSFNAVVAVYSGRTRAVVNTVLALCGSTMATYLTSALFHGTKFSIVDVLNATLAGGVSIGSSADWILHPYEALLVGMLTGILTTICYNKLTPFLEEKAKLFDTCGTNNLHGIPGLIGGFISAIVLGNMDDPLFEEVFGRSQRKQALIQLAGMGVSVGVAVFGGLLVSALCKLVKLPHSLYNDDEWWDLREVEVANETVATAMRRRRNSELEAAPLPQTLPTQPSSPQDSLIASQPISSEDKP